jgi:Mg2+-importing ATPase
VQTVRARGAYWSRSAADLLGELDAAGSGLTTAEAARRLDRYGANSVEDRSEATALRLLLRQFESPLVLILVFAALVSLVVREWVDASIILAIVMGSSLLGFAQEHRASAAVASLRQRLALTVRVLRDGADRTVAVSALVPGDVILLAAGSLVPADGVILEANDFLVSEAALTGESFPVEKQPGVRPEATPIAGRTNAVFLGTSVRSGTAKVLVVETGRATAFGAIATRLLARPPETEFARGLRQFGNLLLRVMIVMVLFVLTVNLLLHRPVIESLLFAVALAVGISPELLPAIVSVTLSRGARMMAKKGVIVRRLEAIENLGSIDVLCTDKTGTLTEGAIALSAVVDEDGRESAEVRHLAYLNAALETGIANPLDAAIVAACEKDRLSIAGFRKIDEIPYDFIRKRITIVVAEEARPEEHLIVTKGAFDGVLAICTTAHATGSLPGGAVALDAALRTRLADYYRQKGAEGFRVLAVATRRVPAKAHHGRDDEAGMSFAGLLLFLDPPKPDAQRIVRDLAALGIRIKVVTGDNRYVAAHLAATVGLDALSVLTGEEIARMNPEALWNRAPRTDLFVEVDPQQKERIVRALQRAGHAVGYMGDGINDAPALHAADVGISVDQAVDVARESADVILLQRDLDVLRSGVEDGRRTFANTLKYINITTSANFGNMVSMALATGILPFLPLAAKQILLNNFLSDLPSVAISTDNVDPERVAGAQRWDVHAVRSFMITFGLVSTVFDLLTFFVLLKVFRADEATFQTAWFVVSLLTELAVVLVLRTRGPAWLSRPGRTLLGMTIVTALVATAIPYLGRWARIFGLVPLPSRLLGATLLIVLGYVLATETAKVVFWRAKNP